MVKYSETVLDTTFAALSDVTRRGILARLVQGEISVSELAAPYRMSLPAVSKHLRVLKDAAEWIGRYRQFWEHQFDALADYLAEESRKQEVLKWQAPATGPKPNSKS